jgi:hypothetical protein
MMSSSSHNHAATTMHAIPGSPINQAGPLNGSNELMIIIKKEWQLMMSSSHNQAATTMPDILDSPIKLTQ